MTYPTVYPMLVPRESAASYYRWAWMEMCTLDLARYLRLYSAGAW